MKFSATLLLTTLCYASAFGLNGKATNALKKVGFGSSNKINAVPMVQPIELNGAASSLTVRRLSYY
jgi:hypothetical protein